MINEYVVLDLEMTGLSAKSDQIIEIGAVKIKDNQVVETMECLVNPKCKIPTRVVELTGITDEMVMNAPKFNEAFKMFTSWCMGTEDDITIYSWSDSDYIQISKEIELKGYEMSEIEKHIVGDEWTDFQNEFDCHLGFERQVSLKMALDMAGIDFSGREHDALDDARNTAELLQLFSDEKLFNKTLKKIEELMKPSSLENTLGSMFDFSSCVFV